MYCRMPRKILNKMTKAYILEDGLTYGWKEIWWKIYSTVAYLKLKLMIGDC